MKRKEFYSDGNGGFIDKEPGESTYDLKTFTKQGGQPYILYRKELEIGL